MRLSDPWQFLLSGRSEKNAIARWRYMGGNLMSKLFGRVRRLLEAGDEKGLTEAGADEMVQTGLWPDFCEAATPGKLKAVDREEFRKLLGLPSLLIPPILLKMVRAIEAPATEAFELLDFFNKNNKVVKFGWIDGDLARCFPNGHIPAEGFRHLAIHRLLRNATEKEFRVAEFEKTTWADLKYLLEQQPKGEKGDLRTNGQANLFFIGSRLVDVRWRVGGWSVNVFLVSGSNEWCKGYLRFSRN